MSTHAILPANRGAGGLTHNQYDGRGRRYSSGQFQVHYNGHGEGEDAAQRQAELFYLQKQIQSQTPMVIVLEDGEHIEGQIEWYDRNSIKVRGRSRSLIFKAAIKYMYKVGETGQ